MKGEHCPVCPNDSYDLIELGDKYQVLVSDLLAEVVGECHVARERVAERPVELEHFEQVVALDDV